MFQKKKCDKHKPEAVWEKENTLGLWNLDWLTLPIKKTGFHICEQNLIDCVDIGMASGH